MNIIITGSLGNISKPLATKLVKAGHNVTVISSDANKTSAIEALGAKAAIGSVTDQEFLTKTFTGADAIYTMVPPNYGAPDIRKHIASVGEVYAAAIKAAGVKKVVNLSSIGAHLDGGTGPIAGLHDVENTLRKLDDVAVKNLRAGFFYVNFHNDANMIKNMNIMGGNYPANVQIAMVHPDDIADAAAEELQSTFTGNSHRYVISDDRNITDVVNTLGTSVGKPELPWVEFTDEQALGGMMGAGLPEPMASAYVEMGTAVRNGKLFEDYNANKPATYGKTKLEDFAKEFAAAY